EIALIKSSITKTSNVGMDSSAKRSLSSHPSNALDPSETLLERFNRYFSAVVADTPDLIHRAQEIRYQVYCVEHKFENAAEHTDGREKDDFDSHSTHGVLIHRPTGQAVGTVRLVLPRHDALGESFAIQRVVALPAS